MELYEIENYAMFDKPVPYKGITIYPITIPYYHLVKAASSVFSLNVASETDIELVGLPYMEYMMKKALKEPEFMQKWHIFNSILELSFQEQMYSFKYEGDFLKMIIAVPTKDYNKETMRAYKEKLNRYNELTKDSFHSILNELQIKELRQEIDNIASFMFEFHTFDDNDFEEIKKIICFLNDIDDTVLDVRWEKELQKADELLTKVHSSANSPKLEDLINAVAFQLHKLPSEIENMTVRRFNRYLDLGIEKENYLLCRQAEMNGVEFKVPIKHWLKAYKVKGRYSGAQTMGGGVHEMLNKQKE